MGIIGFPLFGYVWDIFGEKYENYTLRFIGAFLGLLLAFHKTWPRNLHKYRSMALFFTTVYWFPFFFTFMALKNEFSPVWGYSLLSSFFILIVFTDWRLMLSMCMIGILAAILLFVASDGVEAVTFLKMNARYLFIFLFLVVFATYFSHQQDITKQEKEKAIEAQAAHIVHEVKRPITGIKMGLAGLKASANKPEQFKEIMNELEMECMNAIHLFDMFLINSSPHNINRAKFEECSINQCITQAKTRFPYRSTLEAALVKWEPGPDWSFYGSQLLTTYTIKNLLKNALDSIFVKGAGTITISTQKEDKYNVVTVHDTGEGISDKHRKRIFKKFYTLRDPTDGTGLGLSFVWMVMKSYGGHVKCSSEQGNFAEFSLYFPDYQAEDLENDPDDLV